MKKEWFESWFESDLYDIMYQHRDDDEARLFLDNLLDQIQPAPDAYFLDLACGTGRHARYIHSCGYRVTGIDLSQRNIKLALQQAGEGLEFYIQDMRKPFRINYYDIVLNLFTSFGYFDDVRDNIRVIQSVKAGLKDNGVFVLDYLNPIFIKNNLTANELKDYGEWRVEIQKEVKGNRLIKNMHWSNGAIHRRYSEKVSLFTMETLSKLLIRQGFRIEQVYGNYDLKNFDEALSPRIIIISSC